MCVPEFSMILGSEDASLSVIVEKSHFPRVIFFGDLFDLKQSQLLPPLLNRLKSRSHFIVGLPENESQPLEEKY